MNQILANLKDPKTTIPAIIVAILSTLQAFGILVLPAGVQEAIITIALVVVGLFAGGITSWETTIPSALFAVFAVLKWFGVEMPPNSTEALATLCIVVFGLLSGKPIVLPKPVDAPKA